MVLWRHEDVAANRDRVRGLCRRDPSGQLAAMQPRLRRVDTDDRLQESTHLRTDWLRFTLDLGGSPGPELWIAPPQLACSPWRGLERGDYGVDGCGWLTWVRGQLGGFDAGGIPVRPCGDARVRRWIEGTPR